MELRTEDDSAERLQNQTEKNEVGVRNPAVLPNVSQQQTQ